MRKLLLILPFCCSIFFAASQNFLPGYLVKNGGDTSRGYIENLPTYQVVQHINFKINLSESEATTYTIKDLTAFGFDGGKFFRALEYKDALHDYVTKTEFAKILIQGYYDLYSIPRETKDYFYIRNKQDTGYFLFPDELDQYELYTAPGNYKNILSFLSRDCNKNIGNFETLFYSERDIVKIVSKMNECLAPGSFSQISQQKTKIKVQGLISANGMYLGYKNNQYNFHGALRVMFPELNRKLSLNLGLTYYEQYRLLKTEMLTTHKMETVEYTHQTSFPLFVNYYFLEGRVRPYILAGVSTMLWESGRTLRVYNSAYNDGGIQENQLDHLKSFWFTFVGAAGVDAFLYKGLGIKAEVKLEFDKQWPTIGVFYLFNK